MKRNAILRVVYEDGSHQEMQLDPGMEVQDLRMILSAPDLMIEVDNSVVGTSLVPSLDGLKTRAENPKKTVLFYCDDPSLGGVASHCYSLAQQFLADEHKVIIRQSAPKHRDERLITLGEKGARVSMLPYDSVSQFQASIPVGVEENVITEIAPSLIIFECSSPMNNYGAMRAALARGIPYVVIVHVVEEYMGNPARYTEQFDLGVIKSNLHSAEAVLTTSKHAQTNLAKYFRCNAVIIHNAIDPLFTIEESCNRFLPPQLNKLKQFGGVIFLTVARYSSEKGFGAYLKVLERIKQTPWCKGMHFVWAGPDHPTAPEFSRESLQEHIDRIGMTEHCTLLGRQSVKQVIATMDFCDVFVLPSRQEGMPLVIGEALARGMKIVTTGVCGTKEIECDTEYFIDGNLAEKEVIDKLYTNLCYLSSQVANVRGKKRERIPEDAITQFSGAETYRDVIKAAWGGGVDSQEEEPVYCLEGYNDSIYSIKEKMPWFDGKPANEIPCDWPYFNSQSSEVVLQAIKFPDCGCLTVNEAQLLYALGLTRAGGRFLEIGSFTGLSAYNLRLAEPALIHLVDPLFSKTYFWTCCSTAVAFNELGDVRSKLYSMTSDDFFKKEVSWPHYDLVFIDGDHEGSQPANDARNALKVLAGDGIIIFHDTRCPAVQAAINVLRHQGMQVVHYQTHQGMAVCYRGGKWEPFPEDSKLALFFNQIAIMPPLTGTDLNFDDIKETEINPDNPSTLGLQVGTFEVATTKLVPESEEDMDRLVQIETEELKANPLSVEDSATQISELAQEIALVESSEDSGTWIMEFEQLWPQVKDYTMLPKGRACNLYVMACSVCHENMSDRLAPHEPLQFLEVGCCKGGSTAIIAAAAQKHAVRRWHVYAFDTFEGLPAPGPEDISAYNGDTAEEAGYGEGELHAELWQVKDFLYNTMSFGVQHVSLIKGDVRESLEPFIHMLQDQQFVFFHMDLDWYDCTLSALEVAWPHLVYNAVLQIDDYHYWKGCAQAIHEFEHSLGTKFALNKIEPDGVWFRKPVNCRPKFPVPVVLIMHRRPVKVARVMEAIAKINPERLFVIADGPANAEQKDDVAEARAIVNEVVDQYGIRTYFRVSDVNNGGPETVRRGLDWVFSEVDRAIILEDDCVPTEAFFRFCDWGLEAYADNQDVFHISGNNFSLLSSVEDYEYLYGYKPDLPYFFSCFSHTWGWATWADRWKKFIPDVKDLELFDGSLENVEQSIAWERIVKAMALSGTSNWDYMWMFSMWKANAVAVLPRFNLVSNIGMDETATHQPDHVRKELVQQCSAQEMEVSDEWIVTAEIKRDRRYDSFVTQFIFENDLQEAFLRKATLFANSGHELSVPVLKMMLATPDIYINEAEANTSWKIQKFILKGMWDRFQNNKLDIFSAEFYLGQARFLDPYFYINTGEVLEMMVRRGDLLEACFADREEGETPWKRGQKIKFGILLPTIGEHTETWATFPFLLLNPEQFEVTLFYDKAGPAYIDHFMNSNPKLNLSMIPLGSREEIAVQAVETIRRAELDVLYFAQNMTCTINASVVLACKRLAGIQLTSHNSPVTTGLSRIDGYLTSSALEVRSFSYSEAKLMHSSPVHQCFMSPYAIPVGPQGTRHLDPLVEQIKRAAKKGTVYACGGSVHKLSPETLDAFMHILKQTKTSTLVMYPFNPNWQANYDVDRFWYALEAAADRIDPERKENLLSRIIIPKTAIHPHAGILRVLEQCDIYLDPLSYSGVTSLIDALICNLPVVTRKGSTPQQRTAAATLEAIDAKVDGLDDYAAMSYAEYIRMATTLNTMMSTAEGRTALKAYRTKLQQNLSTSPLFDAKKWAQTVGDRIIQMFEGP